MRFNPWKCPECGKPAAGTLETIPGMALLTFDENGEAEYDGETKVYWDGQTTVTKTTAELDEACLLQCPNGHEWPAEQLD